MSNFFNGATAQDMASLNTSSKDLTVIVKDVLSSEGNVEQINEILSSDMQEFDREVQLVTKAIALDARLEQYSLHDIRDKLSRRINIMSKTSADIRGSGSYMTYNRGRVVNALMLDHVQAS